MTRTPAPTVNWDQAIANLHTIFSDLDKKARNERDRARKKAKRAEQPQVVTKVALGRCEGCGRFSKEKLCAKCQG